MPLEIPTKKIIAVTDLSNQNLETKSTIKSQELYIGVDGDINLFGFNSPPLAAFLSLC